MQGSVGMDGSNVEGIQHVKEEGKSGEIGGEVGRS